MATAVVSFHGHHGCGEGATKSGDLVVTMLRLETENQLKALSSDHNYNFRVRTHASGTILPYVPLCVKMN